MFNSRFLTQAADRAPINATPTRRSKLFQRRAAMRYSHTVPAQQHCEKTDDTPETTRAIALMAEARPTGIQPTVNDLVMAGAEPATEVQGADAVSATVPAVVEPSPVESGTAVRPDSTASLASATKTSKRGRKREKQESGATRRKCKPSGKRKH